MASVSSPPSSYPTYPAGDPISLDIVCFSVYSLMSNLMSLMPISFASTLHTSVLPTPVGPTKSNDAMGLSGSMSPAFDIITAPTVLLMASSCPYISALMRFPRVLRSLLLSLASTFASMRHTSVSILFITPLSTFCKCLGLGSPSLLSRGFCRRKAPASSTMSKALSGR